MTTRRTFIKNASLLSSVVFLQPSYIVNAKTYIGLQLYTVRDQMKTDATGTLERVAKIGFNSLEGATYTGTQNFYGMSPKEFSSLIKQNGFIMPSCHYRLGEEKQDGNIVKGTLLHEWDKAVDDAAELGIKYMVCAYLSQSERGNADHYKYLANQFNKAGETCKKAGIQFCYHNHDFEFQDLGGILPFNILLNETQKDLVKMELDLYWVQKAGHDPVKLFEANPGRFPLWHLKDMEAAPPNSFTEVGNGSIDFKKIFSAAKKAGQKYFFVEQDKCAGSPFDSITKSYFYIRKNLM